MSCSSQKAQSPVLSNSSRAVLEAQSHHKMVSSGLSACRTRGSHPEKSMGQGTMGHSLAAAAKQGHNRGSAPKSLSDTAPLTRPLASAGGEGCIGTSLIPQQQLMLQSSSCTAVLGSSTLEPTQMQIPSLFSCLIPRQCMALSSSCSQLSFGYLICTAPTKLVISLEGDTL